MEANGPKHPEQANDININESSIDAFFANSVVLITGGTGFVGKVLVAKLLQACPRLTMIFVLIRSKRNKTVEQRFKSFLEDFVFNKVRSNNLLNKVRPIEGDVSAPDLGLSLEDKNMLLERVNVVFHSAATIRFCEPIKVAVNLNTRGTDRMIELCKSMKNLVSFVHVSTAFSNLDRVNVGEVIYPTNMKPSTVIDMCESLNDDMLNVLEKKVLETYLNTYIFTKQLAEQLISEKSKGLTVAIVRPSIIGPAIKEPVPGWVDNFYGLTGALMEIGRGSLRSVIGFKKCNTDVVPVDYVVDTLICAAWHNTIQHSDTVKIYNCTNTAQPLSWGELNSLTVKHAIEYPSIHNVWYPTCTLRTSKVINNIATFALQIFPAFLTDLYLKLKGDNPQMMKFANRVIQLAVATSYFRTHEWYFHQKNMFDLEKKVKLLKDADNFTVTMKHLDWDTYMHDYVFGIRTFLLNDPPETLKKARSKLNVLYWLNRLAQVFSIIVVLLMIVRIIH